MQHEIRGCQSPMPISGSLLRYFGVGNRSFVYSRAVWVQFWFNLITDTTGTVESWNQWMHVLLHIVSERWSGCVEETLLSWLIWFCCVVHNRVYPFPGGFRVCLRL